MFTGIIETLGTIQKIEANGSNRSFWLSSPIAQDLRIDQSLAHDGVCLTVEEIRESLHRVTAIKETLDKTNIKAWKLKDQINLERCLSFNGRLDGHIVQGHVDCTLTCKARKELNGSWEFTFELPKKFTQYIIEKGSITINGISLTVFDLRKKTFKVAIIPYTFGHTNIKNLNSGMEVNAEFDLIGKYILRSLQVSGKPSLKS